MTIWSPRLSSSDAPIYARIADALERDVRAGVVLPGSQLPTHRELARMLRVTPVTVTRAYAEAAKRGLVVSNTGRGTFVRGTTREEARQSETDLATNVISTPLPDVSAKVLQRLAATLNTTSYGVGSGSERHRAAGAAWIGGGVEPSRVVVTAGTQHALFLAFAVAAKPGDTVLVENVTYHGAKAIASLLHLRFAPLPLDRHGILPDAFERVVRARGGPRVVYLVPTLQNPTATVMPEKRRREIARIAEKYGVTIIEDDVTSFLVDDGPAPIARFAPDRTIYLTGLGKAVAPALRTGFMTAPDALLPRLHSAVAASLLFTSPLVTELAATWIEDGTAAKLAAAKRAEVALRQRAARHILGRPATGDERSPHIWLALPPRWTPDTFAAAALRRNIRVASATNFAVGPDIPRAVRVSIGAPESVAELESALNVLANLEEESGGRTIV
ncbi:MAG TPA: PLP-dependent aminotransferase family protein [Thermoanaerobaculia bacterium]|nr:PLP-dependent aminotransferase family protein [Thermoanaerobaculia bacterium]